MRWLMYFTIGFGAACLQCTYWEVLPLWGWGAVLLGAGILRKLPRGMVLAVGFAVGGFWYSGYSALVLAPVRPLDSAAAPAAVRASDYSYETDYGMAVVGTVQVQGRPYQVRAYLDPGSQVLPGQILEGDFRFRLTTPDGEEGRTYHPGKGIFLLAYQEGKLSRSQGEESWWDFPPKLRQQIQEILESCFPGDAAPFAKALLLGDASGLGYEVDTHLKVSGIRHVAAVSGLHVSILFALVSTLALRRRVLTAILCFPALALFTALAGFSPSVVRASIMCALMLTAMVVNREYDSPTALSAAVLVMLLANPFVITSASLQLSAASVAGIYLFQGRIRQYLTSLFPKDTPLLRGMIASVSITLSAMSLTTPLCAWYFGMVSLISPVTNLLTLWIISAIFYGIAAVCLLFLASPALAALLAGVVAWPIRYVLWVAKTMAQLPLSAVYTENRYILLWLLLVYLLLLAFLFSRNRRPGTLVCCAVLGLCICLLSGDSQKVRFTVLDVGQGQCLLFQSQGITVMVDCGGDSGTEAADLAAEALLAQGIGHLDVMILTHLDEDHAAGAAHFLSRMETGLLVLPWSYSEEDWGNARQVLYATQDLNLTAGGTQIRIFSPGFPGNDNELSLCILFDTKMCDILVTGDRSGFGEALLLEQSLPDVDILVAGHHGAADSTSEALLNAVRPETVCISAGRDNPSGHPAPELLSRLQKFGCRIYRTDLQGTITIRR